MSDTYLTTQGDTVDYICWKYYGAQSGLVELVLEANPGLADIGPELPAGMTIVLPDRPAAAVEAQPLRLWG